MSFTLLVLFVWALVALGAIALVLFTWAALFGTPGRVRPSPSTVLLKRPIIVGPAKHRPPVSEVGPNIVNVRWPING